MKPDPDINPYLPPAADSARSLGGDPPMKRPASVKWAIVFFTLALLGPWAFYLQLQYSLKDFTPDIPMSHADLIKGMLPAALPLFLLVAAGRRPLAYWAGSVALALSLLKSIGNLISSATEGAFIGMLAFSLPGLLLICWLFYRFAFGRPSRIYFRVIRP